MDGVYVRVYLSIDGECIVKIQTERELVALLTGLYLGKSLDMVCESSAGDWVQIGDFDSVTVTFSPNREHYADSSHDAGWLSVEGAMSVAQREAVEMWKEWQKVDATGGAA